MDYTGIKRQELIKMLDEKDQALEQAQHRVTTILEKDRIINDLRDRLNAANTTADTPSIKQLTLLNKSLTEEINELKTRASAAQDTRVLAAKLKKRESELDVFIGQYGALLKVLQGTMDTHIALNDLMIKKVMEE